MISALSRSTFAVHIDCDNLWVYEKEFGIEAGGNYDAIYEKGLPNLLQLLKEYGIRATFFIIGSETERASCRAFCEHALKEGHSLGNHSYSHSSAFGSSGRDNIVREIEAADAALKKLGHQARGFRAPGYQVNADATAALARLGYLYDSSILPGPAGLMMKLYMLLKGEGQGKEKSFNEWQALMSRRGAYRLNMGSGQKLFEIPLAVSPHLRLPIHSTFAYKFGGAYLRHALKGLKRQRGHHIYLLHAVDLLDHPDPARFQGRVVPFTYSFASRKAMITTALQEVAGQVALTEEVFAVPSQ